MSEYTEKHFQDWFDDNRDVLRFMSLEQLAEFAYVAGYKGRETEPANEASPGDGAKCSVCELPLENEGDEHDCLGW